MPTGPLVIVASVARGDVKFATNSSPKLSGEENRFVWEFCGNFVGITSLGSFIGIYRNRGRVADGGLYDRSRPKPAMQILD